jgi:hypothetical protein
VGIVAAVDRRTNAADAERTIDVRLLARGADLLSR